MSNVNCATAPPAESTGEDAADSADRLFDLIPAELKLLPQWVGWQKKLRKGKLTKVPLVPGPPSMMPADITNPGNWGTYEQAAAFRDSYPEVDGIGFVFTDEDPYLGVDLDDCLDPDTGEIQAWARDIIESLDSYTEVSPSKTGVKIWVKASKPLGRCKEGDFEMYGRGRYFTVTGLHLAGTPLSVNERQTEIDALHAKVFGTGPAKVRQSPTPNDSELDDDELVQKAKAAKNGEKFQLLWEGDWEEAGYESQSEADLSLCIMLAFWTAGDREQMDDLFRESGLFRDKWDERRGNQTYGEMTITKATEACPTFYRDVQADAVDAVDATAANKSGERASQADLLVGIAKGCDLFHDQTDVPYARVPVDGHMEVWPVGSEKFRRWLGREFYRQYRKAPNGQALAEAENVIAGEALFAGDQRPVHIRVAPDGFGGQYIDLADASWRTVHLTVFGWEIVSDPPVCFRRPPGMQPLPVPVKGGSLEELRRFVNPPDEESWALLKAWLLGALYWKGPYPLLALQGQQGSAKSTTARVLRRLIDPSKPELRADPRSQEDLAIAAKMNHVVALDNISSVQQWLSDGLCRLATGGGFATRRRYTVEEEALFDAERPCLITGITRFIDRPDLLERAIQISLPPIADENRRTEEQLWADFEEAQPRIFGALLTRLSQAMATLSSVKLERLPRMADFARLAVAAERGAGEPEGFIRAYEGVRESAHEQAIDASPIGTTLMVVLAENAIDQPWRVPMGTLLKKLDATWGVGGRKPYGWPTKPNGLTNEMTRLAPALTAMGIVVIPAGGKRSGGNRNWTLHDPKGISLMYGAAGASEASTASSSTGWAPAADESF